MKRKCGICGNDNFIDFKKVDDNRTYSLCKIHYDRWIISQMRLEDFITHSKKLYDKEQMRLL